MDYEKAYKEALNRAKLLKNNPEKVVIEKNKGSIHASEIIFPELRESEDEKIKKDLIDLIKAYPDTWRGHNKEYVVAWLEKNGEQKPVEWSEEDERSFQIVIDILDRENHSGKLSTTDLIACVRKLKSLKPQAV